jgi:putative transposase
VSTDGKPVFVGLASGSGESTDAWADFLTDLADRGLGCPLLVVSDGARGLIAAIEQVFPAALRQRCLIHRLRNVLAKIPAGMQSEIRDGYWAAFDTAEANIEPGPRLVELVDARLGAFAARYAATYPAAMKILGTDSAGLTAYLRFPAEHHHRIRHSNFIERTFRRNPPPRKGYRSLSRRDQLHQHRLGRTRPRIPRLARTHHDPRRAAPAPRPTSQPATPTPAPATPAHPDSASSTTETVSVTA